MENGLTGLTSRDAWENSNARFVRRLIGSGFIAPIDPPADEIFSGILAKGPVPSRPPRPSIASSIIRFTSLSCATLASIENA
jgi:hypothetical protein